MSTKSSTLMQPSSSISGLIDNSFYTKRSSGSKPQSAGDVGSLAEWFFTRSIRLNHLLALSDDSAKWFITVVEDGSLKDYPAAPSDKSNNTENLPEPKRWDASHPPLKYNESVYLSLLLPLIFVTFASSYTFWWEHWRAVWQLTDWKHRGNSISWEIFTCNDDLSPVSLLGVFWLCTFSVVHSPHLIPLDLSLLESHWLMMNSLLGSLSCWL